MAICTIKWALKRACLGFPDFGLFLLYFWLILGSKWVFSCQIPPKWPTVINVFIWDQLVPLSTILVNINTSGWTQMVKMHFLEFLVFLQKTLAAHISAPRRGTEAVQYSKSSSGGPLCSQTSSCPWGSIIRPPEPQKWAGSKILKISKFSPFGPKNPFFWVQKAANGYRTAMPSNFHQK